MSGMAALRKLQVTHYDLVFLDQMMPGLDGIETLKTARAMTENLSKDAPIIALTANAISGVREKLIGEGFDDYLAKPINAKLMEQMLVKYLPSEKLLKSGKKIPKQKKKFRSEKRFYQRGNGA